MSHEKLVRCVRQSVTCLLPPLAAIDLMERNAPVVRVSREFQKFVPQWDDGFEIRLMSSVSTINFPTLRILFAAVRDPEDTSCLYDALRGMFRASSTLLPTRLSSISFCSFGRD